MVVAVPPVTVIVPVVLPPTPARRTKISPSVGAAAASVVGEINLADHKISIRAKGEVR